MNKTAQPKAGKPETGEPETGQSEKPLQVLVVDDKPLARSRMRSLLGDCRNHFVLPAWQPMPTISCINRKTWLKN